MSKLKTDIFNCEPKGTVEKTKKSFKHYTMQRDSQMI